VRAFALLTKDLMSLLAVLR